MLLLQRCLQGPVAAQSSAHSKLGKLPAAAAGLAELLLLLLLLQLPLVQEVLQELKQQVVLWAMHVMLVVLLLSLVWHQLLY